MAFEAATGCEQPQSLLHGSDVVNTNHLYILQRQPESNSDRPSCHIILLVPQHLCDESLTGMADQQRASESVKPSAVANELQVMLVRFAKPDSRVEADPLHINTLRHQRIASLCQVPIDILHDIVITRFDLHCQRRPLHVHGTQARTTLPGNLDHPGISFQSRHIVNDLSPQLDCLHGHIGLAGVNRDRDIDLPADLLDNWQDPVEFFLGLDRLGTGPCTFPANIQDQSSRLHQPLRLLNSFSPFQELPAIGEAIRSNVDDSHQAGRGAKLDRAGSKLPGGNGRSIHALQLSRVIHQAKTWSPAKFHLVDDLSSQFLDRFLVGRGQRLA